MKGLLVIAYVFIGVVIASAMVEEADRDGWFPLLVLLWPIALLFLIVILILWVAANTGDWIRTRIEKRFDVF